ncbi:hypothetical protein L207DRAFT_510703 [Hyaloscypha variabilis F]|uniref:Uncharacterized protein n=1 Tax=Hyaloscypha variabilis (strain UAMH 11265 / GT02V1 / F) TaxID=1149755 RepID=A0A2J6RVD9_HYAVF|nr:hypothetical protein L207DRAFT_510703 [Hyaloscypha variabilis F]
MLNPYLQRESLAQMLQAVVRTTTFRNSQSSFLSVAKLSFPAIFIGLVVDTMMFPTSEHGDWLSRTDIHQLQAHSSPL